MKRHRSVTTEIPHRPALSRYELLHPLGEGGVGKVFVALDRETGERVALKKLTRMTPVSVLRFKREFRALANIGHRNLVKLYELEHADDGWFLTMELVEGVELLHGLDAYFEGSAANDNDNESLRLAKLIDAFGQLAQAVHAIHQAGMLHRDLKPSNVMLEREGRVVVLDFGLVRELGQDAELVTVQGTASGTPGYMPPEQARGEELSEASDWYAFGVMLYQALSGVLPIDGRSSLELIQRKLQHDAPPLPRSAGPSALRRLCAQLLRRDARERPSAAEILGVLSDSAEARVRHDEPPTHPTYNTDFSSLTPDTQTSQSSADLFGRDAERLQLEAALASCLTEHTTVVVHVRGPSGSGKTALVQSFLSDSVPLAAAAGVEPLVLRSRCYEREAMPFKSIDGVVDALATHLMKLDGVRVAHLLPRDIGALTALFPVFERVPAIKQLLVRKANRPKVDSLQLRRRAEEGFRSLLSRTAESRPLVLWIDDLQWGDLDSTLLLQEWLKHPGDEPVLLLLSYRSDDVATSQCLSELISPEAKRAQRAQQRELELQPLKDADMHALCWKRMGPSTASAAVIARIVRNAQGNPFLATQLAALARAKLARGETDLSSLSIEELVQHTSAMLSEPAQQLLRVLSVAGQPLAPRTALEASEVSRDRRAHLHELQTLRLVRTRYVGDTQLLEVYHDGVRRSVLASLSAADRTQIHQALLRVLLEEGSTDAALLHELALGAGERGRARSYGILAAETASANLAFERAAELYERCVQLAATNAERAELLRKLARAQVRSRRGSQAADAYLKASELVPAAERVDLLQLAASHLLRSGRFEEGERLVQEVLQARGLRVPGSEAGLYAAIGWERARIALLEHGMREPSGVVAPTERMRTGMLYAVLALDTQCYLPLRATLFQMRATRICFQHGDISRTARAYCLNAALTTLSADASAAKRVDEMLARAEALTARDKHAAPQLELYAARATCAMLLGRVADVIEPACAAEELYSTHGSADDELGDYFYMFVVRTAHVSALHFLARHREAADGLRSLLEDATATNNRCATLQATLVRTGIEQVESCCRDSRARLDAERSELPKGTISVLHVLHVLSVIRAACMSGEHDWALDSYADFKPKFEASPLKRSVYLVYQLRVNLARLLLNEHVRSRASGDPQALVSQQLRWLADKAPVPFRKPAPLRLRARIAAIRGERERAAELLRESQRAHAEIGALDEAERDRYALGQLQQGPEGQQLTAAAIQALRSFGIAHPERDILAYYPELTHGA